MSTALSKDFLEEEFDCRSGDPVPREYLANLRHLVSAVLQPLRTRWGAPLIVTSGYRSPAYNEGLRAVSDERARRLHRPRGGVAIHSRHLTAEAADIQPTSPLALPRLCALVEEMIAAGELSALGGWGRYPRWVHLDVRPGTPGHPIYWVGAGVGSEP